MCTITKSATAVVLVAALHSLVGGCVSGMYNYATSEDGKKVDQSVSYSVVESFNPDEKPDDNAALYDEDVMPVVVKLSDGLEQKDDSNWTSVLWLLTCGIFPAVEGECKMQDVTVLSPMGEKKGSYRMEAKRWGGWIPIFVGYPSFAKVRSSHAKLSSKEAQDLEGQAKNQLVESLARQFSNSEYKNFAQKANSARRAELKRIADAKKRIEELVEKKDFTEAEKLLAEGCVDRNGSLKKDRATWRSLEVFIADKKEDHRVATKSAAMGRLFDENKYEEVIKGCKEEKDGVTRHRSIWSDLLVRARKALVERDRKIELARIESRKKSLEKLCAEKKYGEVIAECDKEIKRLSESSALPSGSRREDAKVWSGLKTTAQVAKAKIDRANEEQRIAAKMEQVKGLLSEKKYSEVVAMCDVEMRRFGGVGSKVSDLAKWRAVRADAVTQDVLSKSAEISKNTFCIKGFHLGMRIDEAESLLDHYFPDMAHKRVLSTKGPIVSFLNRTMHFCETEKGRVVRLNFTRKMLEKWFDYDAQSDYEWIRSFAREHELEFRSRNVRERKTKGSASVEVSQPCYSHKNIRKRFQLTYFGEKDISDYNKDPDEIIDDAKQSVASLGIFNMEFSDLAYKKGYEAARAADCVKQVRDWLNNWYDNENGAEEGTLRLEQLAD